MDNQKIISRKGFSVIQCKAANYCTRAVVNTDKTAKRIENLLEEMDLDKYIQQKFENKLAKHQVFEIVFSGCPNCCSRPQIKDIGIIAKAVVEIDNKQCIGCMDCEVQCKENALAWDGSNMIIADEQCIGCGDCIKVCSVGAISKVQVGYRIIVGGRLGRHPQLALEIFEFADEKEVIDIVKTIIKYYLENANKNERLGDVIARLGVKSAHEFLANNGIYK